VILLSGYYSDDLIEEIKRRNDIVEVISEYVSLRRAGKDYVGLCPFHAEKTPSFTVSPDKQMFYCFGCQVGGNVFTFLMQREKVEFGEALQMLAKRAGITPPQAASKEMVARNQARERQLHALVLAARYFQHCLQSEAGKEARAYLDQRQIDEETRTVFRLGWAPPHWDALLQALGRRGVKPPDLVAAGLVSPRRDGGYYDRFRGRLMFPIHDRQGRVIGFGGRILGEGDGPKYLNSPETNLFNKRHQWYGMYLAKDAIRAQGQAIVVEGYMDVITCHRLGIKNVVASLGTALSQEQARSLAVMAKEVVIAYDADAAGQRATLRGLGMLTDQGVRVRVAQIPAGYDPDSLLREKGLAAWQQVSAGALPLVEYHFQIACRQFDARSVEGKARIAAQLAPVLARLQNAVEREGYVVWIARELGVSESSLVSEIRKALRGQTGKNTHRYRKIRNNEGEKDFATRSANLPEPAVSKAEQAILQAVLADPAAAEKVWERLEPEDFPTCREVARVLRKEYESRPKAALRVDQILAGLPEGETKRALMGLLFRDGSFVAGNELAQPIVPWLDDFINTIIVHRMKERLHEIQAEITALQNQGSKIPHQLLAEQQDLNRRVKEIRRVPV
jgi:DNA primase